MKTFPLKDVAPRKYLGLLGSVQIVSLQL